MGIKKHRIYHHRGKGYSGMDKITLTVHGMTCSGCQQTVSELPGIESVEVSLQEKKVVASYDDEKITVDNIQYAIEYMGYEVQ